MSTFPSDVALIETPKSHKSKGDSHVFLMREVKEMSRVIVLKQTAALGPQTTILARFNLVSDHVLMSGKGVRGALYKPRVVGCCSS